MATVCVSDILTSTYELELQVATGGAGLTREVRYDQVQKSGLAMAGFHRYIYPGRIQVIGHSEMSYLKTVPVGQHALNFQKLCEIDISCIVVTRGVDPPLALLEACDDNGVALLTCPLITAEFSARANRALATLLAPTTAVHGVMMDVFGVGIMLMGHSGIGKSECALDLVFRGHRLIADDIVEISNPGGDLLARGYELIKHHMEIRGIGIINIHDLFGIGAVRDSKRIDLFMEFVDWDANVEYDRLGLDQRSYDVLGISRPHAVIPVRPGRNMAVIVEIAARNELLKAQGHYSAHRFQDKLMQRFSGRHKMPPPADDE